jgi:hypothetical protein
MLDRIGAAGDRHVVGKFRLVILSEIHTAADRLTRGRGGGAPQVRVTQHLQNESPHRHHRIMPCSRSFFDFVPNHAKCLGLQVHAIAK